MINNRIQVWRLVESYNPVIVYDTFIRSHEDFDIATTHVERTDEGLSRVSWIDKFSSVSISYLLYFFYFTGTRFQACQFLYRIFLPTDTEELWFVSSTSLKFIMGNKHSLGCCYYSSPQPQRKVNDVSERRVLESNEPGRAESTANLQHISEREPEDWQSDPSLHPKAETIFMERSRAAIHGMFCCCLLQCLPHNKSIFIHRRVREKKKSTSGMLWNEFSLSICIAGCHSLF